MHPLTRRPSRALVAAAAAGAMVLAGCSGGTGGGAATPSSERISQQKVDAAMKTDTNLTFWTWVPDIQNEVKLFEAKYPAIHVKVVNVGQGAAQY